MGSFLGALRALFICFLVSAAVADSACKNPKIRREWRKLTSRERTEWIGACLAALPHDPKLAPSVPANISLIPPVNETSSFFDDIVYAHMDLNTKIHYTGLFFPWHRYYVQYFEDALAEKCGYKGTTPYWDWTQDAHDFYNSNFFNDSSSGVGAWGDPADDYQIHTGGLKDIMLAYPIPHHIRRNFTLFPFANPDVLQLFPNDPTAPPLPKGLMINVTMTKEKVDYAVNNFEGDFIGFHANAESGIHGGIHLIITGDVSGGCPKGAPADCRAAPTLSPNDPLFFMHHAMLDKVWYDWQGKSPKNKYSYGGGSITPLPHYATYETFPTGLPPYLNFDSRLPGDGLWDPKITVWDVMDTTGGTLCYVYA